VDIPATSDNIPGTLVLRDNSGGFTCGAITATGNVSARADFVASRSGNNVNPSFLQFRKSRGTTDAPTVVSSGDSLGSVTFAGYDGSINSLSAAISVVSEGTIGSDSVPARISVNTRNLSGDYGTRVRITPDGLIGIGTTSPNAAALLDITSTTRGFLPPRMTTAQRDAISSPPAGLMIYNTTTNKLNVHTASSWEAVTSA
jgi:hypothetical protein